MRGWPPAVGTQRQRHRQETRRHERTRATPMLLRNVEQRGERAICACLCSLDRGHRQLLPPLRRSFAALSCHKSRVAGLMSHDLLDGRMRSKRDTPILHSKGREGKGGGCQCSSCCLKWVPMRLKKSVKKSGKKMRRRSNEQMCVR
jgi:hypothetical protein